MPQLDYNSEMRTALNGLDATAAGAYKKKDTYIATEEIKFGRGVVLDGAGQCALPSGSTDQFLGVAHLDPAEPEGSAGVDSAYPDKSAVCVMKQGSIWVEVEEAVTPADDVFCRFDVGAGGSELGIFRTDADTATAFQVTQARWKTSAGANEYAELEINIP